jgi:hypothetical protein
MDKNAIFTVFPPATGNQVSNLQVAKRLDLQRSVLFQDDHAVHTGLPEQPPVSFFDLEILGEYGSGMIFIRRHARLSNGPK